MRAHRLWMGRRLVLLGASSAIAAVAAGIQVARLNADPTGAAVHGVALVVTLIVFVILLRLVRLQLGGPGLEAPSWERHEHRASLGEAPLVAFAGLGIAAFMLVATPRLVAERRASHEPQAAVQVTEPDRATQSRLLVPQPIRSSPVAWVESDPEPVARVPKVEVNYRWLDSSQQEDFQDPQQEPIDPTRPSRDAILKFQPEAPRLPPVRFGLGTLLATGRGTLDLVGDAGRFELDLDKVSGEQTFDLGADVSAEFALTPESALKILYAGVGFFERGHLEGELTVDSAVAPAGASYEFEMRWSHLYVALSKRLTPHTRDDCFAVSVHAGAMIDHTLAEFETDGLSGESEGDERGWVSAAAGLTLALNGPGPLGFVLEFVQSAPLNIGGQAIALTDLRSGLTLDITEDVSVYFGYRYVRAVYRLFEAPVVRQGGDTAADLLVRGPAFGVDFRF